MIDTDNRGRKRVKRERDVRGGTVNGERMCNKEKDMEKEEI